MDIKEVKQLTDSRLLAEHKCSENPLPSELKLLFCASTENMPFSQWQFHTLQIAKALDVKAGEAVFIGELLAQSMVAVAFCPFCGEKLSTTSV